MATKPPTSFYMILPLLLKGFRAHPGTLRIGIYLLRYLTLYVDIYSVTQPTQGKNSLLELDTNR